MTDFENRAVGEGEGYKELRDADRDAELESPKLTASQRVGAFFASMLRRPGRKPTQEELAAHADYSRKVSEALREAFDDGSLSVTSAAEVVEEIQTTQERADSGTSKVSMEDHQSSTPAKSIASRLYEYAPDLGFQRRAAASREIEQQRTKLREDFLTAVKNADLDEIEDINQHVIKENDHYTLRLSDISVTGSCMDGKLLTEALAQEGASNETKRELHKLALKNAIENGYADVAYIEKFDREMRALGVKEPMKEKLNEHGQDLLHLAVFYQPNLVAPLIRKHKAKLDVNSQDKEGNTPLMSLANQLKDEKIKDASLTAMHLINNGAYVKGELVEGLAEAVASSKDPEFKEVVECSITTRASAYDKTPEIRKLEDKINARYDRQQRIQALEDVGIEAKQIAVATGAGLAKGAKYVPLGLAALGAGALAGGLTVGGGAAVGGAALGVTGAAVGTVGAVGLAGVGTVGAAAVPSTAAYIVGRMAMTSSRAFEDYVYHGLPRVAEKLGKFANESIRSVYNAPRIMSADSAIKAAIKDLDALESRLSKDLPEATKRALTEVKAQEKLYFADKDAEGKKLSEEEKTDLLLKIHANHAAVYNAIPEEQKAAFERKSNALIEAIAHKGELLEEITNARAARDAERFEKEQARADDKLVRDAHRANHNEALYKYTIGVYNDYVLQPIKESIAAIAPGFMPRTAEIVAQKAKVKAAGDHLAKLSSVMGGVELTAEDRDINGVKIGERVRDFNTQAAERVAKRVANYTAVHDKIKERRNLSAEAKRDDISRVRIDEQIEITPEIREQTKGLSDGHRAEVMEKDKAAKQEAWNRSYVGITLNAASSALSYIYNFRERAKEAAIQRAKEDAIAVTVTGLDRSSHDNSMYITPRTSENQTDNTGPDRSSPGSSMYSSSRTSEEDRSSRGSSFDAAADMKPVEIANPTAKAVAAAAASAQITKGLQGVTSATHSNESVGLTASAAVHEGKTLAEMGLTPDQGRKISSTVPGGLFGRSSQRMESH